MEYLPTSLEEFVCRVTKLEAELALYNNLRTWQATHPDLMKAVRNEIINLDYQDSELITTITKPKFLAQEEFEKISLNSNEELTNLFYQNFILRDGRSFSWENNSPKTKIFEEINNSRESLSENTA